MTGRVDDRLRVLKRHRKKLALLGLLLLIPLVFHGYAVFRGRMRPPALALSPVEVRPFATLRGARFVSSSGALDSEAAYVRNIGSIREVRLVGTPADIGQRHARLLKSEMDRTETVVWGLFRQHVTSRVARALLLDLARLRYAGLDGQLSEARKLEIAAQAQSYTPDPFEGELPTYQRLVYLNALYDISLSFEQSPLIGCTTFVGRSAQGGGVLARAFDFEVDPIFDREKVVFLVRETGKLPFASVAWAGLVGVVSGMNSAGLSVVVHGARAGEPGVEGEPVAHALRRVLSDATDTAEAVRALGERAPLVSHLVILNDAKADARVVERVPGHSDVVRSLAGPACVTNHLEGESARDPKNQRVRQLTSTLQRRHRGDELTRAAAPALSVEQALIWLRDRKLAGGKPLDAGDRRAIDAGIATHAIIADSARRQLWVSQGPNLDGAMVVFDLNELLASDYVPEPIEPARASLPTR